MGPESTIPYYHDIVYGVQEKIGKVKKPFYDSGIEIVVPNAEEMDYINYKISSELEHGIVNKETLKIFQNVIAHMQKDHGIEAVVLDCTELPLLLNDNVSPVPCLDTMQLHIQALIEGIV